MSPANVYRFFPSKIAIVQAICQRCLSEVEEKAWAIARSKAPASQRLERLILEILAYHKENLLTEQRVNDIVLVAIEQNWDEILAHKETLRTVVELILRDGIEAGEFEPVDPREASQAIMRSLVGFCHPVLIAQSLQDGNDVESRSPRIGPLPAPSHHPPQVVPMPHSAEAEPCPRSDDIRFSSFITHYA